MLTLLLQSLAKQKHYDSAASTDRRHRAFSVTVFAFVAMIMTTLAGCGSGGYPGGGITGLSATSATIDAGQTFQITASTTSDPTVTWMVSGGGSVSGNGNTTTYTAPTGVTKPITVTVTATISGTSVSTASTITVNPDPTITGTLPSGTVGVPYTGTLTGVPGTAPLTLSVVSSTLPAGLTFNTSTGVLSGTPTTAGVFSVTAKVTDSSATPFTATVQESVSIFTGGPVTQPLVLIGAPPAGTVGTAYTSQLAGSGGTPPYTFSQVGGTIPPGLTISASGLISGNPTMAGTYTFTAQVKDSTGTTASAPFTVMIANAGTPLMIGNPPPATVGQPYTGTIPVTGGKGPYSCTIVGALPAGLMNVAGSCVITGTPTTAGMTTVTVTATDSTSPTPLTTTGPVTITVNSAPATLTLSNPPTGAINVPYNGNVGVNGGISPYACTITGTLPAGLTASGCNISGTPTASGSFPLSVSATDSSSPKNPVTGPVTLTINPATITLTLSSPPPATVQTPYTGNIGVMGGTAPYTCTIVGTLPTGFALLPNSCTITGTTTQTGPFPLTVTATDSANPKDTVTGPVTLTVNPLSTLTLTGSLPPAVVNQPYSQTITATGGLSPYTYTITSGALPNGITLNSSTGNYSGTPTTVGAYSFTETVTDSENPTKTASLPLVLQVVYACGTGTHCSYLNGPYAYLFQGYDDGLLGVLAYQTATVGSFTANGSGVISSGELDANHQTSTAATGTTVATQQFLGTYTIGADNRGLLTLTTLNTDGTVNATTTYEIAVKAPVSPATNSAQGSLSESDSNSLAGTKGSGSLLAQTATSFTTGLAGSYVFGTQGETPCLLTCALNVAGLPILAGGPVASVGTFTTNNGTLTGTGDSNVSTANVASSTLAGTYGAADGNGRVKLTMTTSGQEAGVFPTDYAVYMVNANQAFVLSTDVHSTFDLLAGSTTLQTTTNFTNAANAGSFVGYENSASNPGLVGATLQGVLNFSTATIFQATNNGSGTCTVNAVDQGGVTSLVSDVTGLLGNILGSVLQGLLGTYATTGNVSCTVTATPNGRETITYPPSGLLGLGVPPAPRVAYLSSANTGYFIETGYAALGHLEAQTGAPYTLNNTFTGTYVYGTTPATSVASIDSSGVIVSNGAGSATATLDLTVGVGTLDVLTLGAQNTYTYQAPGMYGRFTLNGSALGNNTPSGLVIYTINPNRFVLLDTNALTTSPTVDLLY